MTTGKIVLTRLAAVAYSLAVLVMGVRDGLPTDLWGWPLGMLLLCWCASPVVVGLWLAPRIPGIITFSGCFFVLAAIAVAGFAEQWHVLFVGPVDALNGLIMVFVPLYQWLATGAVLSIAWLVSRYTFGSAQ